MSEVPATAPTQDDALSPPTFDVLPLSAETRATLARMGYVHPTPVQRAVFEPASHGKDLVVQARTGTGKTAAFGLPIIEHLIRRSQSAVQTLCLCPTRELALQVAGELERLGEGRQIKPVAIYGGAPMGRQIESLRAGAQVVVGTPGRVLDHIRRKTLSTATIRSLVLDEADEMLSMGFERELNAILDALPRDRQTLLFSATVPPDIERIARDRLRHPEFITLSSDAVGALSISHFVYFLLEDKLGALLRILETENPESAILFCNTKAETESLAAALQKSGYDADWLNGDLPQNEREAPSASSSPPTSPPAASTSPTSPTSSTTTSPRTPRTTSTAPDAPDAQAAPAPPSASSTPRTSGTSTSSASPTRSSPSSAPSPPPGS